MKPHNIPLLRTTIRAVVQSPAAAIAGVVTVTVTLAAAVPRGDKLFVRVEATPTP